MHQEKTNTKKITSFQKCKILKQTIKRCNPSLSFYRTPLSIILSINDGLPYIDYEAAVDFNRNGGSHTAAPCFERVLCFCITETEEMIFPTVSLKPSTCAAPSSPHGTQKVPPGTSRHSKSPLSLVLRRHVDHLRHPPSPAVASLLPPR
ncbi:hypothetical protein I3760_06G074200 [Carya illinoinensis]|nr:hypothetical protein I3760_06G074200 [Carya illinoinensis]